jgi:hypothetical protein
MAQSCVWHQLALSLLGVQHLAFRWFAICLGDVRETERTVNVVAVRRFLGGVVVVVGLNSFLGCLQAPSSATKKATAASQR